jgi:hypothetical protein
MPVIDETGKYSEHHKQKLLDFIENDLLSDILSLGMLQQVIITYDDSDAKCETDGWWSAKRVGETVRCKIFLNAFLVLQLDSIDDQIEKFKEVLAHEYGHHWTLSHLMRRNHNFDYWRDRLPQTYYQLRGLDNSMCYPCYVGEFMEAWYRCDKEIIAEDYKFLFAPPIYGQPHRIVAEAIDIIGLDHPSESVREFIRNIDRLQSLS